MKRHVPKHALPEEIQKMPPEEKVCKYCGVSYLLLHEFKAMEEKVQALERELELCRGSITREHCLQEQIHALNHDLEQSRATGKAQARRIQDTDMQLKSQQDAFQSLQVELGSLKEKLQIKCTLSQAFSQRLEGHTRFLTKARTLLMATKKELIGVRADVSDGLQAWSLLRTELLLQIKSGNSRTSTEVELLQRSLTAAQKSRADLEDEVQGLRQQWDETLRQAQLQRGDLQGRCQDLQKEVLGLQSRIESLNQQLQQVLREKDSAQDMLREKSNETEEYQRQLRKLKFESIITDSRHTRILKEKEDSLMTCQQMYKTLQEELTTKAKQEEHSKASARLAENELELTRTLLRQSKDEVAALTRERESMLIFHQKSIEQLQETLRQKVLSEENWREKIKAELAKERAQHAVDSEEQVLLFKEEARLKLEIEKEKHQVIIQKYQQEQEALQARVSEMVAGTTQELRLQVSALEGQLHASQAHQAEMAQSKEQEIQRLQLLMAESESRLQKELDSKDMASQALQEETQRKEQELEQLTLAHKQLLQQLSQSQEENAMLQDTVRRECEERFELTEALSRTKEQLLELRCLRGAGKTPPPRTPTPRGSLGAPPALPIGQRDPGLTRLPPAATGLLWPQRTRSSGSGPSPGRCLPPQPPPARSRAAVAETRQRLAALLRGRLRQR